MKTVTYEEFCSIPLLRTQRVAAHARLVAAGVNAGLCNRLQHDVPVADALNLFSDPDDRLIAVGIISDVLQVKIDTRTKALALYQELRRALLVERGNWPLKHASQEAITDALDYLHSVERCIADINDDPSPTDEEFARQNGMLEPE